MLIPTQWSICGLNWPADKKGLLKTHPTDAGDDDFVITWFPLTMCQPLTFLCSSRKPPYGLVVIELNGRGIPPEDGQDHPQSVITFQILHR